MGGSIHDWNYLLFEMGVLHLNQQIADWVEILGLTCGSVGVLLVWLQTFREIKYGPRVTAS